MTAGHNNREDSREDGREDSRNSSALDAARRDATLDVLEREHFDLVVIGGGITGAGVAREAVLRGLSVALLEAEDFASGTSSRSSKLVHGGLRYLALGDVALVRETALERKVLYRMAPHLAERRWMVLPVRSRASLLKFRDAITAYEKLGEVEHEDLHRNWGRDDLEREEPILDSKRHPWACAYREYLTDDARLVLANLRAATRAGARALNHAPVVRIERGATSRAEAVVARCRLSGREVYVRARAIVNAAGPWVEAVGRLEDRAAPSVLHLSKGIHVGIPADVLPVRHLLVLASPKDKRSLFAIRRGQITYVGTTDTSHEAGAERWPEITEADVEYALEPVRRHCRVPDLSAADVACAWAGLRPLVAQQGKQAVELSRKDELIVGAAGVVSVAGGKLTGYRPMAIRILEKAVEAAGLGDALAQRPREEPPLPGGDFGGTLESLAASLAEGHDVSEATAERLVRLYGTEADAVLALGSAPLAPGASVVSGEVDWAVFEEGAARVEDVVYRRTRAALYQPRDREALVAAAAARMQPLLGWSDATRADEVAGTRARMASELSFRKGGSKRAAAAGRDR